MTMAFREAGHPQPEGFGFVVPVVEGRTLIAVTFSSIMFPGRAPEGILLAARSSRGWGPQASTT